MKPGDAVLVQGRRRLLARVHDRAGRPVPRRRVRRDYKLAEPVEVRRVRGPPDLRDRRRARWRSSPPKIEKLRELQRAFAAQDRRAQLQRASTACRPASATRSRASSSSIRATSSRRPTRTPAWAARRARSRGASARPSTPRCSTGASRRSSVPESIRFELTGKLPPGVTREGRDAPHPRDLRQARADAQPRDGVRRRRPVRAVARRARHAREHGDRVLGARRGDGGRRHDAALDRRAAARRRPSTRCARRS